MEEVDYTIKPETLPEPIKLDEPISEETTN